MNPVASETEEQVKEIWKALLSISEVEAQQTFFELGGDSLLMIDMFERVNKVFGIEVDPGSLFEDSSLRGFSQFVELSRKNSEGLSTGSI